MLKDKWIQTELTEVNDTALQKKLHYNFDQKAAAELPVDQLF